MNHGLFPLVLVMLCVQAHAEAPKKSDPLPQPKELKQRVLATERASAKERERYSCYVQDQLEKLNAHGEVKDRESKTSESFYVNGQEIDHLLKKDGKPLSDSAEKKEQKRVAKEIKKYSDPKQVRKAEDESGQPSGTICESLGGANMDR